MTTRRQPITASDLPPPLTTPAGAPSEIIAEDLPPAQPNVQAPTRFRQIGVSTIVASAVSPRARVQVAWDPPPGVPGVRYEVRWATDTGATANVGNGFSNDLTARIDTLTPATNYYFWVRAWAGTVPSPWSTRLGPILTASDDTAPGPVTSATASFATDGTLEVRATPPGSTNFKTVRVEIWNAGNTVQLDTSQFPGGLWTWSPTRNRAQTAAADLGTVSTSVTVRLYAVSHTNIDSSVTTVAASSAVPSTPTGLTHTWTSDDGTAGTDVIVTHTVVIGLTYHLSIDTLERQIIPGRHAYTYQQNAAEHGGAGDPVLSLSLVAENGLGQRSPAATATATNAAPPATSIAAFGAFTMVGLTIGASAALDFQDFRVRVYVESVLQRTIYLTALNTTYVVEDGNGNYTFDVATRDRFGQVGSASSQTAPEELVDQGEFIADLRAGLSYIDSIPTTPATLDGLKDDNTSTNVVTYTSSTPWRWTEGIRALEVRHRKSTLSTSASASYYYGVSLDGTTYTWYAGGTASGGVWSPVAQASEAAAQTAATTLAAGIWRISLAATVEARFFRLGHRNTTTSYALREFYPRSLVEADDINVESLSAISANLGTITAGSITGVTITGGTIRTAASGARVELTSTGLKTYDSTGTVVIEATTATDGALIAGVGALTINNDGIAIRDSLGSPITFLDDAALTENGVIYSNGTNAEFIIQGRTGCRLYLEANNGLLHQLEIGTVSGSEALATFSHSVKVTRFLRLGSTAFPASPNTNDLYYRTDLDMLCYYDGVRWLTAHEYSADFMLFDSSPPFSAAGTTVYAWAPRLDYSLYITQARALTQVAATNNGSNYWTISLYRDNTAIWTFNTSADTAATLYNKTSAINAVHTPTTWMRYRIDSETGTAGNINMSGTLYYRLVIT